MLAPFPFFFLNRSLLEDHCCSPPPPQLQSIELNPIYKITSPTGHRRFDKVQVCCDPRIKDERNDNN